MLGAPNTILLTPGTLSIKDRIDELHYRQRRIILQLYIASCCCLATWLVSMMNDSDSSHKIFCRFSCLMLTSFDHMLMCARFSLHRGIQGH